MTFASKRLGPMRSRVVAFAVAGAAAAALGGAAVAAPSRGARAAATPRCSTANLRLDFVSGQGFTSHRAWDLGLRNVGPTTCHLRGFPGVGLLDVHANLIGVSVDKATSHPVGTVVLHPWKRAVFTFVYVVSGPCIPHFFSAYGLQVFPPNSAQRLVWYAGRFDVCNPSVGGNPSVGPVRP
jgi:hypothetical protein